jgi:hypothetical protein
MYIQVFLIQTLKELQKYKRNFKTTLCPMWGGKRSSQTQIIQTHYCFQGSLCSKYKPQAITVLDFPTQFSRCCCWVLTSCNTAQNLKPLSNSVNKKPLYNMLVLCLLANTRLSNWEERPIL